jgi:rhodanese-related sulfurtransferase
MVITSDLPAEIAVGELEAWRRAGRDVAVLDVREDWEVALCALPDSLKIPMQQVPARRAELPQDKPLVVMCHHGGRSRQVMQWLRANGFPQAINLAGGIHAWAEQIEPGMAKY